MSCLGFELLGRILVGRLSIQELMQLRADLASHTDSPAAADACARVDEEIAAQVARRPQMRVAEERGKARARAILAGLGINLRITFEELQGESLLVPAELVPDPTWLDEPRRGVEL